jgi:hypothetical protein
MLANKKPSPTKKPIKTLPPQPICQRTTTTITALFESILSEVNLHIDSIERRNYMDRCLPKYAYIYHLINPNDFLDKMFSCPATLSPLSSD